MKTGINLLLWTPFVTEEHYPILHAVKQAGYDGVELPVGQGDVRHYAELGRELDQAGLDRTLCLALEENANPASPDPAVRRAAIERLRSVIGIASAVGAELICGPLHSAFKVFTGKAPTGDERRWSAEVLFAAAEEAERAGVQLAIEALNRFECYLVTTMAEARDLVRAVDHPSLGVHYDTHHMHIEEQDAARAIEHVAEELRHVHISENDRGTPGKGQVSWSETFRTLRRTGYDGWLTIEAFSRLDPGFAGAIHIWRDYFRDPEEVYTEGLAFLRRMWAESDGAEPPTR